MAVELDHLFVCTRVGAPEADHLSALGLTEGRPNLHPGQGTACRRFFFRNAYLELLWVHDEGEARGEQAKPLGLWRRWRYRRTRSSPFGLGLRPAAAAGGRTELPFEAWPYRPPWLPPPLRIEVAENASSTAEPLVFYAPFFARPDSYPAGRGQPLDHPLGVREVTRLRVTLPGVTAPSKTLGGVGRAGAAEFAVGETHLSEVVFDHGVRGRVLDLRPDLPLLFRW